MTVFNNWSSLKRHEKQNKNLKAIIDIIFLDVLILYQLFFSPQVRQRSIISNKSGIYNLYMSLLTT